MKALLELERIVTTQGSRKPLPRAAPRRERRRRDREQIREMKRKDLSASTAVGSDNEASPTCLGAR